jgi:osmotically-inducible protein OsmY
MSRHNRGILFAAAVLALGVFVAGCKTTTTAGTQRDDTAIKTSVKAKLATDVRLSTLTNIEVNSTNGIVTLAGKVHNPDEKRFAEQVTKSVKGVVKVNNELQVERKE